MESEYKLDVPLETVEALWSYIQDQYGRDSFNLNTTHLTGTVSVEAFIDSYFDTPDRELAGEEISLRYRKRFKDDELLKELIQLKTPYSADKVVREEIKFKVEKNKKSNQLHSGHELLKYLSNRDAERLRFYLTPYAISPADLGVAVKLKQTRSRVYIKNQVGESIATITLDQVSNFRFPFEAYAELELELNEVRYTSANALEREAMESLNKRIKSDLAIKFPGLKVDQRTKYLKMLLLIERNWISEFGGLSPWLIYLGIITSSLFFFIKDYLF